MSKRPRCQDPEALEVHRFILKHFGQPKHLAMHRNERGKLLVEWEGNPPGLLVINALDEAGLGHDVLVHQYSDKTCSIELCIEVPGLTA